MDNIVKKSCTNALMVCLLLFISSLSPAQEISEADVPRYPNSEIKKQYRKGDALFTEAWLVAEKSDFTGLSEEGAQAAEDYLKILQVEGWQLKTEHRRRNGADFFLKKEVIKRLKVDVGTAIKGTRDGKAGYVFFKSELSNLIPSRDAFGPDPPDVPRYPGSVRERWMNIIGEWTGKYKTLDSKQKVEAFFKQELPKYGWTLTREQAEKLSFEKGGVKSPGELPAEAKNPMKPLEMISKMIPTTLNLMITEEEGITDIGFGRSAGSADAKETEPPTAGLVYTPENRVDRSAVVTSIDLETEVSVYPGAGEKDIKKRLFTLKAPEVNNIKYELSSDALLKQGIDIGTFYNKAMPKAGWILEDEKIWGLGSELIFKKGAIEAKVKIRDTGIKFLEKTTPQTKIPQKTFPVEIEISLPIPSRDISGEDIAGVPRFPGSKRFYYLNAARDELVKYKAAGSVDEVYAYYINGLPQDEWVLSGADQAGIMFTPAGSPTSGVDAFSSGKWIPTTLVIKAKNEGPGIVDIGIDLTEGG